MLKTAKDIFNNDALTRKGYSYTTNASFSSYVSSRRITDAVLELVSFEGRKVLDLGCGDGTYTLELFDRVNLDRITGVDLAEEAVKIADQKKGNRSSVEFMFYNAATLAFKPDSFDLVHIRGLLHHMEEPFEALKEALRVAPEIIVIEPNGYNPILKLIELFSPYHRRHRERSYSPLTLNLWVNRLGAKIYKRKYINLVPFFCPDVLARLLKSLENFIERLPVINSLLCGQYILVARRIS